MWPYFLNYLLPLLVTAALGAGGWYLANFVFGPWARFCELRQRIHHTIIYVANVSIKDNQQWREAVSEVRREAAELAALNYSFPKLIWHYARCRKYNRDQAYTNLIGLSNAVGKNIREHGTCPASFRHEVEKGLKLPLSDSPEYIADLNRSLCK
jgi:hypothetical protein